METPNKQNELSSSIVVDPMSPTALAEAAYAAGAEHRKKRDEERSGKPEVESLRETQENDDFQNSNKRRRLFGSEQNSDPSHNEPISNRSIEEVVGDLNRSDHNEELKSIVFRELDKLIQGGLEAFLKKDELERELAQVKDLSEGRGREVQKLKASEENSRASLSNLLKAVEASKSSARDMCRAAQTEARLRGEISNLRSERDTVIGEGTEAKRKVGLLEDEGRLLKARVARLTQEKVKVERDSRASLSLARSMDTHNASDVDYYKRKVTDLNDHLQSKNAVISELRHQVDEYRRQMERSLSQNRLAQIRGEGMNSSSGNRRR